MAKKNESPQRNDVTPDQLRVIAELVEQYAKPYREAADVMEKAKIGALPITGMENFQQRALSLIRSHAAKVLREAQAEADIRRIAGVEDVNYRGSVADDPRFYVVAEDPDYIPPPKRTKKKPPKKPGDDK